MNPFHAAMVAGIVLGLGGDIAPAQLPGRLVTDVPFEFVAVDKMYPAGEYEVSRALHRGLIVIGKPDGSERTVLIVTQLASNRHEIPRLVFRRYGPRYYLSQIWCDDDTGRQLPVGRDEKEVRSTRTEQEPMVVAVRMR